MSQPGEDGDDQPVEFFSRKLLPREERYATVEKECLEINLRVQAFHVYLLGRDYRAGKKNGKADGLLRQWDGRREHQASLMPEKGEGV